MVSLSKNQTVSLSKESSALSQLQFGLGWDPVKKKGLLGGLFGGNDSIDLDAGCVLMDSTGKTIDTIWFRKLESTCGAVVHSGDNLGDFRSIEEADAMMRKLKATGVFKEVSIVKDQINIPL